MAMTKTCAYSPQPEAPHAVLRPPFVWPQRNESPGYLSVRQISPEIASHRRSLHPGIYSNNAAREYPPLSFNALSNRFLTLIALS
jgi:hypothetical protein